MAYGRDSIQRHEETVVDREMRILHIIAILAHMLSLRLEWRDPGYHIFFVVFSSTNAIVPMKTRKV
jgi:hypothetical protein